MSASGGDRAEDRVAHDHRRLGRVEDDDRLAALGAADRLDAGGGGPGELVDVRRGCPGRRRPTTTEATISAYDTGAARETAATIGIVAWPPQVIMLTFIAPTCSSPLTGGITAGPTAAGREVDGADAGLLVARGVLAVHVGRGRLEDQVRQLVLLEQPVDALVASTRAPGRRRARGPRAVGSTPIIQRGSITSDCAAACTSGRCRCCRARRWRRWLLVISTPLSREAQADERLEAADSRRRTRRPGRTSIARCTRAGQDRRGRPRRVTAERRPPCRPARRTRRRPGCRARRRSVALGDLPRRC